MQSVSDLHAPLQLLVQMASGVDAVILANQGTPAPSGLYATYNPIPVRAIGKPRRWRLDVPAEDSAVPNWADFQETLIAPMEFLLAVNFFNEGSSDAAWRMHHGNLRWWAQELLYTYRIGWRGCSDVRDLTARTESGIQPHYQVDVNLVIEMSITDTVLRAAGFAFQVSDEDNNLLYHGVSES